MRESCRILAAALLGLLCSACSVTRHIPEGQYFLQKVKIEDDRSTPRKERITASDMEKYVRQTPNKRFLGTNFYVWLYEQADPAKDNRWNNWKRKIGQAPVLLETQEDYDALLRRINAYTVTAYNYNWIARLQSQQHFSAWGVWQEDRLLGEMILSANGTEGVIEMIYARPEFRRRGVAAALVGQAAQELLRIGVRAMVADVWQRNDPATQFFDKMHFETTQPVRLYPGINL